MNKYSVLISLALFCCFSSSLVTAKADEAATGIIYVDDDAFGANNGSSWQDAYIYLQDALADANSAPKPTEIRVAQGIYTPDKGASQIPEDYTESFDLISDVALSGGYAGVMEPNSDIRNIELYETILSGDLLNNDANSIDPNNLVNEPTCFDNSFHVIRISFADDTAVLDGFTIKSGNAGGYYFDYDSKSRGGGIYIEEAGPVITNCTFTWNAAYLGGAIYGLNSYPYISNCTFVKNSANYYYYDLSPSGGTGGAICNNQSSPIISNCRFIENLGSSGAGIYNYNDSNSVVVNCLFARNNANVAKGGAVLNMTSCLVLTDCNFCENYAVIRGGAIENNFSNLELENCIFASNQTANFGGALYNGGSSALSVVHSTFNGNSAPSGGAITNEDSDPNFRDCTFSKNYAANAGAFDNNHGNPNFIDCIFSNNAATFKAGAIQNFFGELSFRNCIFSGNRASMSGGALFNTGGAFSFTNCTFTGNVAKNVSGVLQNASLELPPSVKIPGSSDFLNCIIWNGENAILNENGSFVSIDCSNVQNSLQAIDDPGQGLVWGLGNIEADPDFVEQGLWVDGNDPNIVVEHNDPNAVWLEGDYHLKSASGHYDPNSKTWIIDDVNSPCIDAGAAYSPIADEPLPNGGRVNIGAYGGTTQASMTPGNPLIACWKLNEKEGNIAHDSAANSDGIISKPTWVGGKLDGALQFDGFDTSMNCGGSQTFSTAQMTISLWIEPDDVTHMSYILSRSSTDLTALDYNLILLQGGKIELEIGQKHTEPISLISNTVAAPQQWTHVAVTLNGSEASIYINGLLDISAHYGQRVIPDEYNLIIGSLQSTASFYKGKLDDIRIYDRVLNQEQIAVLVQ